MQIYGRLWHRFYQPRPDCAPAPALRALSGTWKQPARREPSITGPETFVFLGESGVLQEVGWDGSERDRLWRYNQHYFDDLNALSSQARVDWHVTLLLDWVAKNPPGFGVAWEPYPTSLRIVNWIKWALAGNILPLVCLHSLAVQARWLTPRLEIHLLGNHLFSNAKALIFAGLFFDAPEAQQWLTTGFRILEREVLEQVLPDGGHFERSTLYHALALEDMLDICNLLGCYEATLTKIQRQLAALWRKRIDQMRSWLLAMRHPDGEISFFNDAALGIAPSCEELDDYAARLGFVTSAPYSGDPCWLSSSGYARLVTKEAVALLDLAPVGPDYLPGHAHADTLSFELSVYGKRVLVNSGTSCYGVSAERSRQRGTSAHNTVVVAGEDSSEVWGGFRVARRARPVAPQLSFNNQVLTAECSHDGYSRLPRRPLHQRHWEMREGHLSIEDEVRGGSIPAEAYFHFHPNIVPVVITGANKGYALLPDGHRINWVVERGSGRLDSSSWHPRFGMVLSSSCLCVDLDQGRSLVHWSWC